MLNQTQRHFSPWHSKAFGIFTGFKKCRFCVLSVCFMNLITCFQSAIKYLMETGCKITRKHKNPQTNKQTTSHNPNVKQLTPKQNQQTGCINFCMVLFIMKVFEIMKGSEKSGNLLSSVCMSSDSSLPSLGFTPLPPRLKKQSGLHCELFVGSYCFLMYL